MKSKMTFEELKKLVTESEERGLEFSDEYDRDYEAAYDFDDEEFDEDFAEDGDFLPRNAENALQNVIDLKGEVYALYAVLSKMYLQNPTETARFLVDLSNSIDDDYARAARMRKG